MIVRFAAQGIGPFDDVRLDFTDDHGNPHLGPHVFAGVNGTGKSTLLRAIAWVVDVGMCRFPYREWRHLLGAGARAAVLMRPPYQDAPYLVACQPAGRGDTGFMEWLGAQFPEVPVSEGRSEANHGFEWWQRDYSRRILDLNPVVVAAAYGRSRYLYHIETPDMKKSLSWDKRDCLGFESTIDNELVQAWLLNLYSKRAIARERNLPTDRYSSTLCRFERALQDIHGSEVALDINIEPLLEPRLKIHGRTLNFSQIPDGIRSTAAWIADYMMRQDVAAGPQRPSSERAVGLLLLDEVDAHLHPSWQRRVLPAVQRAFPQVQIFVSSHSPFVISSCPGARVHVLDLGDDGRAHARPSLGAPVGESLTATLKDIFGVSSRFDIQTEEELREWNDLDAKAGTSRLAGVERGRFLELTNRLAARSEELRSIVSSPARLSPERIRLLTRPASTPKKASRDGGNRTLRRSKAR